MKKDKIAALSASKGSKPPAAIPQSKYAGMTVMGEDQSANWAWDLLWHTGQQTYIKLKILDAVRIAHGDIQSWIFTLLSDGLVKSRQKARWTLPALLERTVDTNEVAVTPETILKAHVCNLPEHTASSRADDMSWKTIRKKQLTDLISPKTVHSCALITFNRTEGPVSFAEISLEVNFRSKTAISEKPKVVTSTFYEGAELPFNKTDSWREPRTNANDEDKALPQKKLICLNKQTCATAEAYITELKKVLEDRSKAKIARLVVVVLLENMDEGGKVCWLHHVKQVVLMKVPGEDYNHIDQRADNDWDNDIDLTVRTSEQLRQDFKDKQAENDRKYSDKLEKRSNATSDISTSTTTYLKRQQVPCSGDFCECPLDDEGVRNALLHADGNFTTELKRARNRHRREEDSPIKGGEDLYGDSSRGEDHTGALDAGIKRKVTRKIPMKSIALCRKEAETWELMERTNHYDNLSMPWSRNMFEWWFGVGKTMAHSRNSGATVPISSSHNIGKALLGMKPINEEASEAGKASKGDDDGEAEYGGLGDLKDGTIDPITGAPITKRKGDDSVNGSAMPSLGKNILYDLDENSFSGQTRRSVGQLSWYYSEAKVCQTCYQTYRDIDRRRESMQSKQLKAMKAKQMLTGDAAQQYDKEVEKRIFEQRRNASRLAVPAPKEDLTRSFTSPDPTGARRRIVGAPKGVLPPLPWQLREQEDMQKYENNKFSSSIVRNIRTKAQGMARAVQQDKMMERVELKMKRNAMMMGGMLDENSQFLDEGSQLNHSYSEANDQWQSYTGQSRMEVEMEEAKRNAPRKVIGGLGENRPRGHSKNFDTKRLMHGWQRDAEELAKKIRGKSEAEAHTGYGAPIADAAQRRKASANSGTQASNVYVNENLRNNHSHNNNNNNNNMNNSPKQSQNSPPRQGFRPSDSMDDLPMNGFGQGSMVSQLTMDASMMNLGANVYGGNSSSNNPKVMSHKQQAMNSSQTSLEGLDDEDWIRAIMVKGKGGVNAAELINEVGLDAGGSVASMRSNKSSLNRNGARTPKGTLRVSFEGGGNSPQRGISSPQRGRPAEDDGDDDDDDSDDGAIGWSPFVIPAQ